MNQRHVYICNDCQEKFSERKHVRSHVKKCQPQWKAPKPDERPPLSTRYKSQPVNPEADSQ